MEKIYHVEGMSCSACAAAVERICLRNENIRRADVNLVMNQVLIESVTEVNLDELNDALRKAGFSLSAMKEISKVHLDIKGMSCSSCSAALDRVLNRLDGVEKASINLLTNSADVEYDKKAIKLSQILHAIQKAGYEGFLHVEDKEDIQHKEKGDYRIYITLILAAILLYIGMSHMLGSFELPLPDIIYDKTHPFNFALIQFVLATMILILGNQFFVRGMRSLFHGAPNMDTLVAIGTGSAYLYSVYSLVMIGQGSTHHVHQLYFESAGVVVALVMFGKHLEALSKKKTYGAIQSLLSLRPSKTLLWKDGEEIEISIDEVEVGDILVVKPGDTMPVDGVVEEGSSNVDESMLTGESMPIEKHHEDAVIGGTINLDGRMLIQTTAIDEDTMLSKIIHMVEDAQGKKAPIARIADRISLFFVPAVMSIALLAALLWYVVNRDLSFSLTIFVSVLVIACPCALGLATPTAIMVGTGKAAQMGIFMKSGEALEQTHSIDTIVFDKTGTLTLGKPTVTDVISDDPDMLLSYAASLEQGSKHPLALAILNQAHEQEVELVPLKEIHTHNGRGISALVNDTMVYVGSLTFVKGQVSKLRYHEMEMKLQMEGKTLVWVAYEDKIQGIIAIADEIKAESRGVVDALRKQGIDVVMMTGDHEITAHAIAAQAGITHVIAQVLPEQKGEEVQKLQQQGKKVAMVGDGINDAVALTASDVGIAIGSGSDVAVESADVVLVKNDLYDVLHAIRLSKAVIRNIKQNLFWAFFYNTLGIPIAAGILHVFGGPLLSPVFAGAAMAFSSVSVVSNALRLRNFK